LPAEGEYLRLDDFFVRLELDFFEADPRELFFPLLRVLFFALLPREDRPDVFPRVEREREDLLLELLDFFLAAFFVAITILLGGQMASSLGQVVCGSVRKVAS
jgi:hypothetical protein